MVTKNRDLVDIVAQVLHSATQGEPVTKTKIASKAFLSTEQVKRYLFLLIEQGLLVDRSNGNQQLYQASEKGARFLKIYDEAVENLSPMQNEDLISVRRFFSMRI